MTVTDSNLTTEFFPEKANPMDNSDLAAPLDHKRSLSGLFRTAATDKVGTAVGARSDPLAGLLKVFINKLSYVRKM